MSFPLSLQTWHTSSRAMSLRCLRYRHKQDTLHCRCFCNWALHISLPREAKPENDLGALAFLSRVGLAVPLFFL